MVVFLVIMIVMMMVFSAFLSATETAIIASSPGKIQKFKSAGMRRTNAVLQILRNKDKVIGALLIGNTLVNIISTTIATSLFIGWLGDRGTVVSSVVMASVIIVFGEVVPKGIAVLKAEQIALFTAPAVILFLKILRPINYFFELMIKASCFLFRINLEQNISGADEVRGVIEHYHQEGNVYKSDRDMLGGVLDIRQMTVSEIMTHRSAIVAIDIDLPKEEIVQTLLSNSHTRIPLWKDTKDNIIGILHMRDLLRVLYENNNDITKINIEQLVSPPWFIPDNAFVTHQLHAFRERKSHFACVVDEYGDLQGIITLEDILEEIVGPISDEHDSPTDTIIKKSEVEFTIDGSTTIRDLNRELNWNLPDDDANTIAGLVIHKLERIPNQGESVDILNLSITIDKKVGNRIDRVKVTILPVSEDYSDSRFSN